MAVRDDLLIDWWLSPRLITVLADSRDLSIQDLVDTCRYYEDDLYPPNLDDDYLISAAGKEPLGGGVTVGITATFNNTKVAFEARTTPTASGSCTTSDPNGEVLIDSAATFIADGVTPGATIINFTDESIATVVTVDSEIQITGSKLENGTSSAWDVSDKYKIWNVIQCEIAGGNLVAVDASGVEMNAIYPTAFTQIVRTSSASATLQELSSIQYSSFDGRVTIDTVNGVSGTDFPTGTGERPVNNLTDAVSIATTRGLDTLFFKNSFTFPAGTVLSGFVLEGASRGTVTFTFESGNFITGCSVLNADITGTILGITLFSDCVIQDLIGSPYIVGGGNIEIIHSLIEGDFILPQLFTGSSTIIDCWSMGLTADIPPSIDLNGAACNIIVRNYSGGVRIKNVTNPGTYIILDFSSGAIIIDNTCTAGTIIVRGIAEIEDNSNGTTVDISAAVNPFTISDQVWDETAGQHLVGGSMGEKVAKKLATKSDIIVNAP